VNNHKTKLMNIVSNLRILHNLASFYVNIIPFFISHNLGKYKEIRRSLRTIEMDQIEGDYCEFGCFTGACTNHTIKTYNKISKKKIKRVFYGFDSFEGFPIEVHSEFQSNYFKSDYNKVKKLENKYPSQCKIVKGFFHETLNDDFLKNKINNISIAFIDCDIAISASPVFKFIKDKMSNGSFIIVDDYFNVDLNKNSILKEFNKVFKVNQDVFLCSFFGLGGIVFRYYKQSTT